MSNYLTVKRVIHFVVSAEQLSLADYVRRKIHEKRLSYRDVAARSGGLISHGTVSDIVAGKNTNPKTKTLTGLARGLGEREEEISALARGKSQDDAEFEESLFQSLYFKHNRLTDKRKAEFRRILQMVDRELDRLEREEAEEAAKGNS